MDGSCWAIRVEECSRLLARKANQQPVEYPLRIMMMRKEDSHDTVKDLQGLFGGDISKFDRDALRIAAAFNVQGFGASDEATEMIIVGWTAAILEQLGISDIDPSSISNGCPSRRTLVIKRSGIEHFVKILVWTGWADPKKKDRKVLMFHCLDVDASAHDAEGCAAAVKRSLEEFTGLDGFKVTAVTGDAGGGASVHNLLPQLIKCGAVEKSAAKINCVMHGLNKCLESAGQDTFGGQGVNKRTPFQLLFVFNQLWKAIKEEGGGKKYLDSIYSVVVNKLLNDGDWQCEAKKNFKQAFQTFETQLQQLEELDGDKGIDDLVGFITETPSNISDPVFSRWKTVMSCTRVVVQYWTQIYFVAVAIKQREIHQKKHSSYICILASALLSLMKEKDTTNVNAYYKPGDKDMCMAQEFDDTQYLVEEQALPPLERGDTPVFYAMLLFFQAFGDAYFDDQFHFVMKDDPVLGEGSFGQTSRFCVERLYIMHKLLAELENDGWKTKIQFKAYKRALRGVSNLEYFDKMAKVFLERFRFVFDKHLRPCWTSDSILHYILGGNQVLANEFARWLVDYKRMSSDDEEPYQFTNQIIDMGAIHYRTTAQKNVRINVEECMNYLTADADPAAIMQSDFVKSHWDLIEEMGTFEYIEDTISLFDDTTWGHVDFEPLLEAVWNEIAIHACHQQRCENYVQLAALVAKTSVGEVRRTLRAIILSTIIRPFHQWAKQVLAERNPDKPPPRRVEGAARGELLVKFMRKFSNKLERAKRLAEERNIDIKAIQQKLVNQSMKTSAHHKNKNMNVLLEALTVGKRNITKSEEAAGYIDKPVIMSDGITITFLSMNRSCKNCNSAWTKRNAMWKKKEFHHCESEGCCLAAVHAELKERNIKLSKKDLTFKTIGQKRHEIRAHVAREVMVDEGKGQQGFDIKDVKDFVPKAKLMESIKQMHLDWLNEKKGLST
ncbi:hypothetical protein QTG54_015773 [Skeletonema marinoi]|uniref:Uncharacterized protein n=1 Tax=Skeletonema marinoi TaxID=267567 RepID=A0AAD9D5C4_9STRA|nr:hypothetical protein QTG54_015773 [Skeletonema marinoi]